MTALSETIELIEKAMEGVTPGPWLTYGAVLGHKGDVFAPTAKRVTDCHHIARCFAPKPEKPIICELQAIHAAREAVTISEANAAYIAACSPDRMSEVLAAAREADVLKREIAELREAGEALAAQARSYQRGFSGTLPLGQALNNWDKASTSARALLSKESDDTAGSSLKSSGIGGGE